MKYYLEGRAPSRPATTRLRRGYGVAGRAWPSNAFSHNIPAFHYSNIPVVLPPARRPMAWVMCEISSDEVINGGIVYK